MCGRPPRLLLAARLPSERNSAALMRKSFARLLRAGTRRDPPLALLQAEGLKARAAEQVLAEPYTHRRGNSTKRSRICQDFSENESRILRLCRYVSRQSAHDKAFESGIGVA